MCTVMIVAGLEGLLCDLKKFAEEFPELELFVVC